MAEPAALLAPQPCGPAAARLDGPGAQTGPPTDALTGLASASHVHDVLAACLDERHGAGCGLLICDLDGFRAVNDRHGRPAGDLVLAETARRLLDAAGPDDVVGRLAGDVFAVVVRTPDSVQARAVGHRVERAVARPIRLSRGTIRIGVSVGLRLARPGEDPVAVVLDAQAAMAALRSRKRQAG